MRIHRSLPALLLGFTPMLVAQEMATLTPAPAPIHVGTYDVTRSTLTPNPNDGPASCGIGVIYNNSVPDPTFGQLGYFHNAAWGNTILDEGRIPSTSSGGPADEYSVQGFTLGFATNKPRVNLQISFWKDGDTCDTLAQLGPPTAQYNILRIHGSPNGQVTSILVDIDLCDQPFTICGDSNAIYGDGDWDKFVWGFKVLGQNGGGSDETGPLVAGDPNGCLEGIGLFGPLGGVGPYAAAGCDSLVEGDATGLDTVDSFRRAIDGPASSDCYWFGGYPANPIGSFYLKLHSSSVNDECTSASELRAALGPSVVSCDTCCSNSSTASTCLGFSSPSLWYTWVAPSAGAYVFDTCGSGFDTALSVYSGACGSLICEGANDDFCGLQSSVSVSLAAHQQVYIQLQGFGSSACGNATLNINEDPCASAVDDVLGENDVCADALAVRDGLHIDYSFSGDDDWYAAVVCAGDTITFDAFFDHGLGDIDMVLYDGSLGCPGAVLDTGFSVTSNEQVSWTNTSSAPIRVVVRVNLFSGNCNEYTLQVSGDCSLGTRYCGAGVQNNNSTGTFGKIAVYGSLIALADELNLAASDLPPNEFGYFVWSTSSGLSNLPAAGISDGFYCLGSGQGRFNGLNGNQGGVLGTGPAGTFSLLSIDTTFMPQSANPAGLAIFAGLTGYFQAWYRDGLGVLGNNFTDACSVTWQ